MRNPKYHLYLTPDERRTVINSLIDLRNDFISQGKYTDIIDEPRKSRSRRSKLWLQRLLTHNKEIIFCPI